MRYDGKNCPICHGRGFSSPALKGVGIGIGKTLGTIAVIIGAIIVVPLILFGIGHVDEAIVDSQIDESEKARSLNLKKELVYSDSITYFVDPIPDVPDKDLVKNAVVVAFSDWHKNNDELVFEQSNNENSDIHIIWDKLVTTRHSGIGIQDCIGLGTECWIRVGLGDLDCNNKYVQFNQGLVTNIILHEIGHNLGLGHTSDKNNLMYSDEIASNFDELGFNIPTMYEEAPVGYLELMSEYDKLQVEIDDRQQKLDQLNLEVDNLEEQYSKFPEIATTEEEYDRAIAVYDKYVTALDSYNAFNDKTNELIDQSNTLVEKINCFSGHEISLYQPPPVLHVTPSVRQVIP